VYIRHLYDNTVEVIQFWMGPGRCIPGYSNLGNGGVPAHHDPVDGIVTNPGKREGESFPLSLFVVCDNPVHGVMANWDPPTRTPAGWRQVPDPTIRP
jgi:hypothetical protein